MGSFYSEFAPYYEQIFPFREEVYAFLRKFSGDPGEHILDMGCGPGHYCGRFYDDGFIAEGVDLDPRMIEAASGAYPGVLFRCLDLADPAVFDGRFRMICCVGNVLAHLKRSTLSALVERVHAALEPGGCWIFQVVNWDYLLTLSDYTFPEKKIEGGDVSFFRSYPHISGERADFDVRLVAGGRTVFEESATLYPTTSDTYCNLHDRCGFINEGIFAGFDGSVFTKEKNSGLVMVFRKS
ncbi:MAG: class I SAM-dependent methyltransferase [Chlorobiaceae bacterium]|nr:class I SAM-dependent methyltransferase [Chlorobiaceae bacterium]